MSESDDEAQRELDEFEAVLAAAAAALARRENASAPRHPAGAAASGAAATVWGKAVQEVQPPAAKRARTGEAADLCEPRLNAARFRGVSLFKRKYSSRLTFSGQKFYCGYHETAEAAAQAYDAKARELGMEERLLNFPHGKPRTTEHVRNAEPHTGAAPVVGAVRGGGGGFAARSAKTGFFGVHEKLLKDGRRIKYTAKLVFKGVRTYCGVYNKTEEAARAYDAKARELGVQPERLNFPDESLPAPPASHTFLPNGRTGFFGVDVQWSSAKTMTGRFVAIVRFKGGLHHCGTHATAEAAARAYDARARELGMPANRLNFPDESPAAARWRASTPPPPSIPVEAPAESEFESLLRYFTLELVHTSVGARCRLDLPCYARLGYSAHLAHLLSSGQQPEAARLLRAIRKHELGGGGVAAPDSALFGSMPGDAAMEGQVG